MQVWCEHCKTFYEESRGEEYLVVCPTCGASPRYTYLDVFYDPKRGWVKKKETK